MAIGFVQKKYHHTENKETQVDEWVDKATFLIDTIQKVRADRIYEIKESRKQIFKLEVIKYASLVGVLFCGISPYVSERHNQKSEMLGKIGVYLVGLAVFTHFCIIIIRKSL